MNMDLPEDILFNMTPLDSYNSEQIKEFFNILTVENDDTTLCAEDMMDQNIYNNISDQENKFNLADLQNLSALPDRPLANTDFPGDLNFSMKINYKEYSEQCKKIFTKMNEKFPVEFTIDPNTTEALYIRGTLQYAEEHKTTDTVVRCIMHEQKKDGTNIDVLEHVRFHVLRCSNPNAVYLGNKSNNEHLSVVMPLSEPQAGVKGVKELFYFVCMSSCGQPGISRRNLEMIFQLENGEGKVLGRRCIKARICACPKRDKEKEEEHVPPSRGKKRKINPRSPTPGKVALPDSDLKSYHLELDIIGKDNVINTLLNLEKATGYKLLQHIGQPGEKFLRDNLEQIIIKKNSFIQEKK